MIQVGELQSATRNAACGFSIERRTHPYTGRLGAELFSSAAHARRPREHGSDCPPQVRWCVTPSVYLCYSVRRSLKRRARPPHSPRTLPRTRRGLVSAPLWRQFGLFDQKHVERRRQQLAGSNGQSQSRNKAHGSSDDGHVVGSVSQKSNVAPLRVDGSLKRRAAK